MIVLVETNFVLELVFSRDKFASCRTLLDMAEKKEIDLFLPAYSIVEPVLAVLRQRGGPACLITKNAKDFSDPRIEEALDPHDCKLLFDFENGVNFVRSKLAGPAVRT